MKNNKEIFDKAETILLKLADYIYSHMNLKPISKSIFLLSRALLMLKKYKVQNSEELLKRYEKFQKNTNNRIYDDYNFAEIINQNEAGMDYVINELNQLALNNSDEDFSGQIFNSLLRGKYEAGEGMGTYLTPYEITNPIVKMVFKTYEIVSKKNLSKIGDIAGGTGRFLISAKNYLNDKGYSNNKISKMLISFDQSTLHNSLNKINFSFYDMEPEIIDVADSIIAKELKGKKKFNILITNPPFGKNKYRFSESLFDFFDKALLQKLKFNSVSKTIDPCEIFFIKNLILLDDGGVLGIVLPDGFAKNQKINDIINLINEIYRDNFEIIARVSLPKETFSLTGTVALSSFLIITKNPQITFNNIFIRRAVNIGYKKNGNKKIYIKDNDLPKIEKEYLDYLSNPNQSSKKLNISKTKLCDFVIKKNTNYKKQKNQKELHISILDIDNTGLLDINSALKNLPVSQTKICEPGDILISCLNPLKWRVLLVPSLPFVFSCSGEFVVLQAKRNIDNIKLYFSLFDRSFIKSCLEIAKGTSSSRQRINKNELLNLPLVIKNFSNFEDLMKILENRNTFYKKRLEEIQTISQL